MVMDSEQINQSSETYCNEDVDISERSDDKDRKTVEEKDDSLDVKIKEDAETSNALKRSLSDDLGLGQVTRRRNICYQVPSQSQEMII